ncbi:MAG TPA: tetratricopeptide repeat protein, partial [Gemmatimonadales bacterium]
QGMVDSGSTATSAFQNLLEVRLRRGDYAGADSVITSFRTRVPEASTPERNMRRELAMIQGRFPDALAIVEEGLNVEDPEANAHSSAMRVPLLRLLGRWSDAARGADDAVRATMPIDRDQAYRQGLQAALDGAVNEAYLLGGTAEARAKVDAALARYPVDSLPAERRPYFTLIFAESMLGRVDRARTWLAQARQIATPADSADLIGGDAMIAYGEQRWGEAISLMRQSASLMGWFCRTCFQVQIGEAFDRQGLTDSARVAYETYASDLATASIGQESDLPVSYIRLGEIYEAQGDRDRAIEYYTRLLDLWKDADPVLQPRIRDIRTRVGKLVQEGT